MENYAVKLLVTRLTQLQQTKEFDSLEAEAVHFAEVASIEKAIKQLSLCEQHGIADEAVVNVLPETGNIHQCFRVVNDNGSSAPANWQEVKFDSEAILFTSGDCIVRV